MNIVITGGSGFIGTYVAHSGLEKGHKVWSFDRRDGNDILGDLYGMKGANAVIHLAGVLGTSELFETPEKAVDVNVKGTLRILKFCEENDMQYVGITMPPVFPSVYTATKVCADRLATAWNHSKDVPVSKVRAFNAYGAWQAHGPGHPQKILPTFATEAWEGRPIPIWGDGTQTVDLIHASDLGRMLVDAVDWGDNETFDGGTGVAVTVNALAEFVLDVTKSKAGVSYLPMRDGEIATNIVARGEGWEKLGWSPKLQWDKIENTIMSYRV